MTASKKKKLDTTESPASQPPESSTRAAESEPQSDTPGEGEGWFGHRIEAFAQRTGRKYLKKVRERVRFGGGFRTVPDRMHRVANQLSLSIELVDDFRHGKYRDIPWSAVAIISGALLYSVSPADVLPDTLLGVGAIDDALVLALATRLVRKQLEAYAVFKGYDPKEYFGPLTERKAKKLEEQTEETVTSEVAAHAVAS